MRGIRYRLKTGYMGIALLLHLELCIQARSVCSTCFHLFVAILKQGN